MLLFQADWDIFRLVQIISIFLSMQAGLLLKIVPAVMQAAADYMTERARQSFR